MSRHRGSITGTVRVLPPLPQNRHAVDRADRGARALDRQSLRDAQSNAIKQRQHGGVARPLPRAREPRRRATPDRSGRGRRQSLSPWAARAAASGRARRRTDRSWRGPFFRESAGRSALRRARAAASGSPILHCAAWPGRRADPPAPAPSAPRSPPGRLGVQRERPRKTVDRGHRRRSCGATSAAPPQGSQASAPPPRRLPRWRERRKRRGA